MTAQFTRFDKTFVLCSHPPKCVLFQSKMTKHEPFQGIQKDCVPVFATSFPVKMPDMYITRHQVPMTLAFALTQYKVQGSTYRIAVLDLHRSSRDRYRESPHQRYCSVYVQLSRLTSLDGLWLLEPITLNDIDNKMHPELHEEDLRLEGLAAETMRSWTDN